MLLLTNSYAFNRPSLTVICVLLVHCVWLITAEDDAWLLLCMQTCAPACGTSTSVITACVSTRDACVTIVSTAMIDLMSLAAMVVSVD